MTAGRHSFSRQEALALVAAQRAELAVRTAELDELLADPAFVELERVPPHGLTEQRWGVAHQAAGAAGSLLGKWRRTLDDVERLLHGADRSEAVLGPVGRLLRDDCVALVSAELPKAYRLPPSSASAQPRFSLAELRNLIDGDLRAVQRLVRDVGAVWEAARPRIDGLTAELAAVASAADPAVDAAVLASLATARTQLEAVRELVASDPLALHAGRPEPGRAPDSASLDSSLDAVARRVSVLYDRLASSIARRSELAGRIHVLRQVIDDLADQESYTRDRLSGLLVRSDPEHAPAAPGAAGPLRDRLGTARLTLTRDWRTARTEVTGIERDVAVARRAVARAEAWADEQEHPRTESGCARRDCAGGELDGDGICESCFRAPAPVRWSHRSTREAR